MSYNSRFGALAAAVGFATAACSMSAFASVTTVPKSALVASGQYYTDTIGGGIGSPLVMTGGGNGSNVGGSRNDDGFSGPIGLGFTLSFFGQDYNQFWANNNGNISFTDGISSFTPSGPQGAPEPIISPFFADVDTRNSDSGLMYLRTDIANEIIVTWDGVGYYNSHADLLDSFQLVLRGPDYTIPPGEGAIGFFYKGMQWETGDQSGGSNGFGGTPAAVGFGNGSGDGEVLAGSIQDGISGVVANHYIWFDQNLTPVTPPTGVPEPAALGMFGLGALLIGGFVALRRRRLRA
ncbi:nidogen-like domain-containing protein [Mycobacterium sp.]|uniref:nidogen-like domain-containing protein n=1 Tax=Mycobacterium sp. TaxID=1785 RepID=UPI00260C09BA|nr:nidogen-like domain-containing protein [Mycobacterium sp.]